MKLVLAGLSPYAAAKRAQVTLNTMYRSRLYKMWKQGDIVGLKKELDVHRPFVRPTAKKQRQMAL